MYVFGFVDVPLWVITLTSLVIGLFIYSKWKHSLWRRLNVPGPTPTPFFGILSTQRSKGIIPTNVELVEKYGKIVGIYNGHKQSLLVADPEMVKQVMVKEFASFPNRYALFEPGKVFKLTVFFAKDEHWKFIRNTLSPTFSTAKMKDMMPLIKKCYLQLLDNIERQSRDGKALDMKQVFGGYTMDVIASTAFGLEVDSQKDPNNEFVKSANAFFSRSLTSTLQILRIMVPGFSKLSLYLTPAFIVNGIAFFKKAVAAAIDMRKTNGSDRKDFLDLMMNAHKDMGNNAALNEHDGGPSTGKGRGLSLDEIISNSIIFFIAGYDTTANTLSFLAYNLAVHPECQDKVIQEIDDVIGMSLPDYDNVQKLKYLDMVLCETLRLYGPVPRINRKTEYETEIAGYKIPANTEISFPIYVIHRDPENWPEPEKFDPERFTPENKEKRHPYSFMPFGHGPRRCIGMRLAQMEAKTAIVYILQRYRFVRCDETEVPVTYDISAPVFKAKNGIKLKLKPRN